MSEITKKVFYLCDGNVDGCGPNSGCGLDMKGMCRHTSDIEHAKNFNRIDTGDYEGFWEKDDTREIIDELLEIKELLQKNILCERKFIKKARWQQAKRSRHKIL